MNAAPFAVSESCPLNKAYRLFRGMGLRHLPVTDVDNRPVGMITRKDLSRNGMHRTIVAACPHEHLFAPRGDGGGEESGGRTPRMQGRKEVERRAAHARGHRCGNGAPGSAAAALASVRWEGTGALPGEHRASLGALGSGAVRPLDTWQTRLCQTLRL